MADESDTSRIWITYKTRINSERRLRVYSIIGHLAIAWYSFLLIVLSVFEEPANDILGVDRVDPISIILSILLFGLSLVFYGFKFDERANQFRDCYLNLQKLLQSEVDGRQKVNDYHDMLRHYPNHAQRDYDQFLFNSWIRGDRISNSSGEIGVGKWVIAKGLVLVIGGWVSAVSIFVWPIIVAAMIVF